VPLNKKQETEYKSQCTRKKFKYFSKQFDKVVAGYRERDY